MQTRNSIIESDARSEFLLGVRDTIPLMLGAVPFGTLFGVLALAAGLPWWAAQAMSTFVFAGASQFAALSLLSAGAAYPIVVLTTFIVNLRHALYGASVAEYLHRLPKTWQAFLAFSITDESFAVTITHYRDAVVGEVGSKHWYFLGANLILYLPWQLSTSIGYLLGEIIGNPSALGLDFTLPIIFIAILMPYLKQRENIVCALVAALVAILAISMPSKLGLLAAIAAGIAAGLGMEKWILHS